MEIIERHFWAAVVLGMGLIVGGSYLLHLT
jgi:hypothetical protein